MENPSEERKDLQKAFTGGIGRKLSFFMVLSFVVVLLIGGVSILATRSIYLSTQEIDRQSQHVEAIDGIHAAVHHLVSAVHESVITGAPYPDDKRESSSQTSTCFQTSMRSWRIMKGLSPSKRRNSRSGEK